MTVIWKNKSIYNKMKNVINISAQQQQQQSSREDGPGVAWTIC